MRPDPFNPDRMPIDRPYEPVGHHYPLYDAETQSWSFGPDEEEPTPGRPRRQIRWGRWITRGLGVGIILLVIAVIWLAITAPLSRSLQPPTPPSITLTACPATRQS